MIRILGILLVFSLQCYSQTEIRANLIEKLPYDCDAIIGINNFGNLIYTNSNSIYKETEPENASYANVQLGNISSVNAFNPLKINAFYQEFNAVVILDNRLNEIFKLDFNFISPFRNVTFISTGYDNTIWIYNLDTQQLEVFDYKQNKSRVKTLPIVGEVLDLKSNYNTAWLLTKDQLITYNYFGSMISSQKNTGFTALAPNNQNLFLQKENRLYFLSEKTNEILPIKLPELLIKAFFVKNETLYIYDGDFLYKFQLKI